MDLRGGRESYSTADITIPSTTPLVFGSKAQHDMGPNITPLIPSDIRGLDMKISEISIWNKARSPKDIYDTMLRRLVASEHTNLIGYWTFSTRNIVDISSTLNLDTNEYEAEIIGVSVPIRSREFELSLPDNTSYVSCQTSTASSYTLGSGGITFSCWFKTGASFNGGTIFAQSASGLNTGAVSVSLSNAGAVALNLRAPNPSGNPLHNPYTFTADANLKDGNWHHLAIVRNSTKVELFTDGILRQSLDAESSSIDIPAVETIYIGTNSSHTASETFIGSLSEVRIWDSAQSQKEIQQYMYYSLPGRDFSNLQGYWSFDQRAPIDLSVSDNDGVMQGNTEIVPSPNLILNPPASTLYFNNNDSSNYTKINKQNMLPVTGFTLQFWLKVDAKKDAQAIFSNAYYNTSTSSVDSSLYLGLNSDNKIFFGANANTPLITSDTVLRLHQWYEVSIAYDGTNTHLYINGNDEGSITSFTYTQLSSNDYCLLGVYPGATSAENPFFGAIHSFTVWDSCKSKNFISENLFTWYTGSESGLQCYQNFMDTELKDMTGNGYDITQGEDSSEFRVTDFADREIHYSLKLDQSTPGQYIDCGTATALQITSDSVSIQAAVRLTGIDNTSNVIAAMGSGYALSINQNGTANFKTSNSTNGINGTTNLNDGKWHFITGVYDETNSQLSLYVNGNDEGTTVTTSGAISYGNSAHFSIGAEQANPSTTYLTGYIKEVKVWSKDLTGDDIDLGMNRQLIGNVEDLEGYWPLTNTYEHQSPPSFEVAATTFTKKTRDYSNNQYNATLSSATAGNTLPTMCIADLHFIRPQPYIKAQSRLMEDWVLKTDGSNEGKNISVYRTVIQALREDGTPASGAKMRIWANKPHDIAATITNNPVAGETIPTNEILIDPLEIEVNGASYIVDERRSAQITTDANGTVTVSTAAKDLSTYSLKIWTSFMIEGDRIIICPDENLHRNLKTITGPDLQANRIPNADGGYDQPALLTGTGDNSVDATGAADVASALNNAVKTIEYPSDERTVPRRYTYSGPSPAERSAGTFLHPDVQSQQWVVTDQEDVFERDVTFDSSWTLTFGTGEPSDSGSPGVVPKIIFQQHSEEESSAILRELELGPPVYLTDDLMGIRSWWHSFVSGAENVASVAFHKIVEGGKELVQFVVTTSDKIRNFVLTRVKHIGQAILGFLNNILIKYLNINVADATNKVLNFFRNMFNWSDIVNTAKIFSNVTGQIPALLNKILESSKNVLATDIDTLKAAIVNNIETLKNSIGNDTPNSFFREHNVSGEMITSGYAADINIVAHSHKVEGDWLLHKTLNCYDPNDAPGGENVPNLSQRISSELATLKTEILANLNDDQLKQAFGDILNYFNQLISNPHNFSQLAIKIMLSLVELIEVAMLDLAKSILQAVFALFKILFDIVDSVLKTEINLPLITWLFENKLMPGETFNALNLFSLIGAIPATIVYKVVAAEYSLPTDTLSYLGTYTIPEHIFWPWSTGTKPANYTDYTDLFKEPQTPEQILSFDDATDDATTAEKKKELNRQIILGSFYIQTFTGSASLSTLIDLSSFNGKNPPSWLKYCAGAAAFISNTIGQPFSDMAKVSDDKGDQNCYATAETFLWFFKYFAPGGEAITYNNIKMLPKSMAQFADPYLVIDRRERQRILTRLENSLSMNKIVAIFIASLAGFVGLCLTIGTWAADEQNPKGFANLGEALMAADKFLFFIENPYTDLAVIGIDIVGAGMSDVANLVRVGKLIHDLKQIK